MDGAASWPYPAAASAAGSPPVFPAASWGAHDPRISAGDVHIDFETRSECNLTQTGSAVYAEHPSTRVLVMCWKARDRRGRWHPGSPLPPEVLSARTFWAHNARFERDIWREVMVKRHGAPPIPVGRWACTMERANAVGVPGALERACTALMLPVAKDMDGHRLMLKLCKPRKPRKGEPKDAVLWHDDPDEHARLHAYGDTDVDAETELGLALPPLSDFEQRVMQLDRIINDRGIRIDVEAVEGAVRIAQHERRRLNKRMAEVTNGYVTTTDQTAKIIEFCGHQGLDLDTLRAADVREKLADEGVEAGDLDDVEWSLLPSYGEATRAQQALILRAEGAKASVRKLNAMKRSVCRDGRVRGGFAYCGANRTRRWAGRLVQWHNMPRENFGGYDEDAPAETNDGLEAVWFDTLASGDREAFARLCSTYDVSVMDGLKKSQRGMIVPEDGRVIVVADENQIEARMLAWLAGQWNVVEAFNKSDKGLGPDIYTVTGESFSGTRQHGKVAVLGCGYGASKRAIMPFARNYGLELTESQAEELVDNWRAANPMIVRFWRDEEAAAKWAIRNPGHVVDRGHTGSYLARMVGDRVMLVRKLPSGGCLFYRDARIERCMMPWGKLGDQITYEGNIYRKGSKTEFVRLKTYGGKLAENVTQAASRDVLANAMLHAHDAGLWCFMHVHDEVAVESALGRAERDAALLRECMTTPIDWLPGLPLGSSADIIPRYRKL